MKISEILKEDLIIPELKAKNKKEVLEEFAQVVCSHEASLSRDEVVEILLERESLGTTGIGDGTAIPHGKIAGLEKPIISFGKSTKGIDFDAIDGQPVHIFFLLLAPENSAETHLQLLARIAKILKNTSLKKQLMSLKTKKDIYDAIVNAE